MERECHDSDILPLGATELISMALRKMDTLGWLTTGTLVTAIFSFLLNYSRAFNRLLKILTETESLSMLLIRTETEATLLLLCCLLC